MRPLLLPALRRLWRDATSLQLGVDPERAVVVAPCEPATRDFLAALDGRNTVDELIVRAPAGWRPDATRALIEQLAAAGPVIDGDVLGSRWRRSGADATMEPGLAALTLVHGQDAPSRLAARRQSSVVVRSQGRVGPVMAALLAAAGVGTVAVLGDGLVTPADTAVGGLVPADVGRPYGVAAADAIRRAGPAADARSVVVRRPDFVVLAADPVPSPSDRVRWTDRGVPHLPVMFRDAVAIIGPLVLPGTTACLTCVEEHRRDRDPDWPALAAQLATDPRPEPTEPVLAVAAATAATFQVLGHLDGTSPASVGVALELGPGAAPVRHRPWPPHPRCGCARDPTSTGASGRPALGERQ
jgi:bacteriocin biosynthesis cyclodehydratase domain-containing protein